MRNPWQLSETELEDLKEEYSKEEYQDERVLTSVCKADEGEGEEDDTR